MTMWPLSLLILVFFTLSAIGESEPPAQHRLPVELDRTLKVKYGKGSWNTESTSIDSANIIMRDKKSGRILLVRLQETEPDSGEFYGFFSIGWHDQKDFVPLIYIPPQSVTSESEIKKLLSQRRLKRKPYVLRKNDRGEQVLEVFDDKSQAIAAYKQYRKESQKKKEAEKPKPTPLPDESLREAQRLAAIEAERLRLEAEAKRREAERQRLKQLEEQRARAAREKAAKLAKEEKERRVAKARQLAQQAMKAYQAGDFATAEKKFGESVKFDPENDNYYFQYGVTLYRNEKFNRSLIYLKLAKGKQVREEERRYFMALNHLRLKEFDAAIENFDVAIASKDKVIAPSSAFYKGVVFFTMERYEPAKESFQVVLDTSADPRLDRQAEDFIEKIARILQFKELQKKPFSINFMGAAMYDSNVLSQDASGGTSGSNSNLDSMRYLGTLEFGYRPIFTANHELNIAVNGLGMTTVEENLSGADPTIFGLKIPYKYRGKLFGGGWQLATTLNYSSLAIDGADYMRSTGLSIDSTHIPSQSWAHLFKLGLGSDQQQTTAEQDYARISAQKTSLKYTLTNFIDQKKTRAFVYDLGVTSNNALGENATYTRIDLGFGYNAPAFWETSLTSKITYYNSSYPKYTSDGSEYTSRADGNFGLSVGLSKRFYEWVTGVSTLTYNNNSSSISGSSYDKYSLTIGCLLSPRF